MSLCVQEKRYQKVVGLRFYSFVSDAIVVHHLIFYFTDMSWLGKLAREVFLNSKILLLYSACLLCVLSLCSSIHGFHKDLGIMLVAGHTNMNYMLYTIFVD